MELPIIKTQKNRFKVIVDSTIYNKESIIKAIYKYSYKYYISQNIDEFNNDIINIIFETKDNNIVDYNDTKQFLNELIDQQIRYNIDLQFGEIRNMIVKEAFKPINK